MKRLLYLFLSSAVFLACNQSSNNTEINATNHEHFVLDTLLKLNNGAKWKVDSITKRNVMYLRTIVDNFRIKPLPSVIDYQTLSIDLNNSLNKMIQECKMSGPDHEALHHWLEPILKETYQLKNITDTAIARTTFKFIDTRLDIYNNYFE